MSDIAFTAPYVIGYTLSFGLMGALAVQAYIYYTRFVDDRKSIKALVTGILLLEILMTVFTFYAFWGSSTSSTIHTIDPAVVVPGVRTKWWFKALAPLTGLVTTLTHSFYCWRITLVRRSRLLPIPIIMVSLLQLASTVYLAVSNHHFPLDGTLIYVQRPSSSFSPWLVTWLGGSVVCDLAITVCMILSLRPSKSHFRSNKSTLVKLTRLTMETGLVTTVAALLELILGIIFTESPYHMAVFYAISKLYANSLLASLNFRLVLRSQSDPDLTAIVWDDMTSNSQPSWLGSQSIHFVQIRGPMESDLEVAVNLKESGEGENSSIDSQTQT